MSTKTDRAAERTYRAELAVAERIARDKIAAYPLCDVCRRPLTCGQDRRHHTCKASSR